MVFFPRAGTASVLGPVVPSTDEEAVVVTTHGGMTIRVSPLFDGITSWFWVWADVCCWLCSCAVSPPPGVSTTVPAPLSPVWPTMQGWMATVWAAVPLGSTTWFEVGGVSPMPPASEQGGTTMLIAARCSGTITVRTPGASSAIWVGLTAGGGVLDELPPQPASAATAAIVTPAAPARPRRSTSFGMPNCLPLCPDLCSVNSPRGSCPRAGHDTQRDDAGYPLLCFHVHRREMSASTPAVEGLVASRSARETRRLRWAPLPPG